MPSTGNPWLERNQREEKVAVKQSQALHHQMPFIHTLLLSIFLFFLSACLSSCGRQKKNSSDGEIPGIARLVTDCEARSAGPILATTFLANICSEA